MFRFNRLSSTIVKNIYCNDALFRDVIIASFDAEDVDIRRQGVKIVGVVVEKLRDIFAMDVFEDAGRTFRPVLSSLGGKLPDLKLLSDFWRSEVELLGDRATIERDSFVG